MEVAKRARDDDDDAPSSSGAGLVVAKRARTGGAADPEALALAQSGAKGHREAATKLALSAAVRRTSSLSAPIMLLEGHNGAVLSLAFSPSGDAVASGSFDKTVLVWAAGGDCDSYMQLEGHSNAVLGLCWAPAGDRLLSCGPDKTVRAWDAVTGEQVKKYRDHSSYVNAVAAAPKGPPLVVSGSDDCSAKVWDLRVRGSVLTFADQYQVLAVSFSTDGQHVFTGGIDNAVKAWDMRMGELAYTMEGHTDTVTGMELSPDGKHLLTNSMDNTLRMWDVRPFAPDDRCVRTFTGHSHNYEKGLLRCAWSANGGRVSCGSADRMVYVWDSSSGRMTYKLPGHAGCVHDVAFHPTEPIIGSASADQTIYLGELAY